MFCRSLFVVLFIVFYVCLTFTSYYPFTIFKCFPLEYFVIDTFRCIKLFCSLDDAGNIYFFLSNTLNIIKNEKANIFFL
jgi:hypothetical protein